jgi:hypothetical protein
VYGDKLSSFFDVAYRDGSRERLHGQAAIDLSGARAAAEGPVPGLPGSWLFSTRYSTLELLDKPLGLYATPHFIDHQGKMSFDISSRDRLAALVLIGRDDISFTEDEAAERDRTYYFYGRAQFAENVIGATWTHRWSGDVRTNTSVAFTNTGYEYRIDDPRRGLERITNNSTERDIRLRQVNTLQAGEKTRWEIGFDTKFIDNRYDNYYELDTEPTGEVTRRLHVDTTIATEKIGISAEVSRALSGRAELRGGFRADYFTGNDHVTVGPRLSLCYRLTPTTSLNAATGLYYQTLPLILISQNSEHRHLQEPRAYHLTVGFNRLVAADTRISLAAYAKEYRQMPLDSDQPGLYTLDEIVYRYWIFYKHERLVDDGRAYARGIELLVQKRRSGKFHFLIGLAAGKTRYRDLDGVWRDRVVDNQIALTVMAGVQPGLSWESTVRWRFIGGAPYTPFDLQRSRWRETDIFDLQRINEKHLPPYHALYIRLEKRFRFGNSTLAAYLSVWNVYDRENVYGYKWNEEYNYPGEMVAYGIVPVFGFRYEF